VRMNNSSRAMPEAEVEAFLASRGIAKQPPVKLRPFEVVTPKDEERYVTCVPLMSLQVAAGTFGDAQEVEPLEWVRPHSAVKLRPGMFVAQVVGHSMEPKIPDQSYCLFAGSVVGSRQGRDLLVQHREIWDPENGGSYTVKRYSSSKERVGDSWSHAEIRLEPLNRNFKPIVLVNVVDEDFRVIGEVVDVLEY